MTKEPEQTGECLYVRREELEQIRREIKDELQREVIVTLGTALAGGKVIQMPQTVPERAVAEQTDRVIETEADETTLGLASSWG